MVLDQGVLEGRRVFANVVKYVRMGASSNFGNMLSVVGASAFLPFLPMAPIQVLANNLLYDVSQTAIPTDAVDPGDVAAPRPWRIDDVRRFVLVMGPVSSAFDYVMFALMLWPLGCWDPAFAGLFQTGWFVQSLVTQTLIIHVIRTRRLPFLQSRASWPLVSTGALIVATAVALPYSPLASWLALVPLPPEYWLMLVPVVLGYCLVTQIVKMALFRATDNPGRAPAKLREAA
jgi:P-type Mg2+ transporter